MYILIKNDWIGLKIFDTETSEWFETDFEPNETINLFYNLDVEFSPDLTLKGFLNAIRRHDLILDQDFSSWLNGTRIETLYQKANQELDTYSDWTKLVLLKRQIFAERYDIVQDLKWISHETIEELSIVDSKNFEKSPSLSDLHNYSDLSLELGQCLIYQIGKDETSIQEAETEWTLHGVLSSILYSITETSIESIFGLDDSIEIEIETELDQSNNTLKEIQIIELKKLLEECKNNEEYEACARIQAEITKLETFKI